MARRTRIPPKKTPARRKTLRQQFGSLWCADCDGLIAGTTRRKHHPCTCRHGAAMAMEFDR